MRVRGDGSGFRVSGSMRRSRVHGLRFEATVQGSRFRVRGATSGFRIRDDGSGIQVSDAKRRALAAIVSEFTGCRLRLWGSRVGVVDGGGGGCRQRNVLRICLGQMRVCQLKAVTKRDTWPG